MSTPPHAALPVGPSARPEKAVPTPEHTAQHAALPISPVASRVEATHTPEPTAPHAALPVSPTARPEAAVSTPEHTALHAALPISHSARPVDAAHAPQHAALPISPAEARRSFPEGPAVRRRPSPPKMDGTPAISPGWERPIHSRYTDPLELVWLATARRLGLVVRRDESIFSMTDGTGLLALGPRHALDPDDTLAQMVFHELCHWITNGLDSYDDRDWDFPLDDIDDLREYACQRMQAALADEHGLRRFFGPTGMFREYYDKVPADPFAPLDSSPREAWICADARRAYADARGAPWEAPLQAALQATAALHSVVHGFLDAYQTEIDGDALPSLWAADRPG